MEKKSVEAYPLQWPTGYPRNKKQTDSRFRRSLTISLAVTELELELNRLNAINPILSTNVPLTLSGNPRSGIKVVDPGVACYFKRKNNDVVLCCDKYERVQDNIYAIARTVAAIRQIARDGVSDFLDRTFSGFIAIPEKAGDSTIPWWDVLAVDKEASLPDIRKKYLALAKLYHPDSGDQTGRFYLVQSAWNQAQKERGVSI